MKLKTFIDKLSKLHEKYGDIEIQISISLGYWKRIEKVKANDITITNPKTKPTLTLRF